MLIALRNHFDYNEEKEVFDMARTANVFVRVEPDVKEQAEEVLNELGIPMSNAVGMFLKQVVMQRGIPFDVKLPSRRPLDFSSLTKEQFDVEIQKGMDDIEAGRTISSADLRAEMKRNFNL